jgi:hypothetical protein
VLAHRQAPPAVGLLVFPGEEAPPAPPPELEREVRLGEAVEARAIVDDVRFYARDPAGMVSEADWSRLGAASDYLARVIDYLGKVPEPGPEPGPGPAPPPQPLHGFSARVHWDGHPGAADVYAGPKGTPVRLALGGVAEGWGTVTPLETAFATQHKKYSGCACPECETWENVERGTICMEALGLTMYSWVLRTRKQGSLASYALGHVLREPAKFGPVQPWEPVCQIGDSGIETLCPPQCSDCQVAHLHVLAWWGHGPMPANGMGDISAVEAIADLGIVIDEWVPAVPSPQHYQACRAKAGRFV